MESKYTCCFTSCFFPNNMPKKFLKIVYRQIYTHSLLFKSHVVIYCVRFFTVYLTCFLLISNSTSSTSQYYKYYCNDTSLYVHVYIFVWVPHLGRFLEMGLLNQRATYAFWYRQISTPKGFTSLYYYHCCMSSSKVESITWPE